MKIQLLLSACVKALGTSLNHRALFSFPQACPILTSSTCIAHRGATIGGGRGNTVTEDAQYATVGGGETNRGAHAWSFIGGGTNNKASGVASVVTGGSFNAATMFVIGSSLKFVFS